MGAGADGALQSPVHVLGTSCRGSLRTGGPCMPGAVVLGVPPGGIYPRGINGCHLVDLTLLPPQGRDLASRDPSVSPRRGRGVQHRASPRSPSPRATLGLGGTVLQAVPCFTPGEALWGACLQFSACTPFFNRMDG